MLDRQWLIEIRKKENLKKSEIAKLIGVTLQHYDYIEKGERRPSPQVAQRLSEVMHFDKYGKHWSDLLLNQTKKTQQEAL